MSQRDTLRKRLPLPPLQNSPLSKSRSWSHLVHLQKYPVGILRMRDSLIRWRNIQPSKVGKHHRSENETLMGKECKHRHGVYCLVGISLSHISSHLRRRTHLRGTPATCPKVRYCLRRKGERLCCCDRHMRHRPILSRGSLASHQDLGDRTMRGAFLRVPA